MKAYHFIAPDLKTRFDSRQAVVGEALSVDETKLKLCSFGLHASKHPSDALSFAQGDQTTLCLVELSGRILDDDGNKVCASERTILRAIDATRMLQDYAIWCAEKVLSLFEEKYPDDKRPRAAIETARKYLAGGCSKEDLQKAADAVADAADAARAAAWAADAAAYAAAYAVAYAAYVANVADAAALKQVRKEIRGEFQRRVDDLFKGEK